MLTHLTDNGDCECKKHTSASSDKDEPSINKEENNVNNSNSKVTKVSPMS